MIFDAAPMPPPAAPRAIAKSGRPASTAAALAPCATRFPIFRLRCVTLDPTLLAQIGGQNALAYTIRSMLVNGRQCRATTRRSHCREHKGGVPNRRSTRAALSYMSIARSTRSRFPPPSMHPPRTCTDRLRLTYHRPLCGAPEWAHCHLSHPALPQSMAQSSR